MLGELGRPWTECGAGHGQGGGGGPAGGGEEDGCCGLVIVPAYGGLRAPRWRPDAGGVIHGLGLHTRPRHLVRATMEGVGHMLREVWD